MFNFICKVKIPLKRKTATIFSKICSFSVKNTKILKKTKVSILTNLNQNSLKILKCVMKTKCFWALQIKDQTIIQICKHLLTKNTICFIVNLTISNNRNIWDLSAEVKAKAKLKNRLNQNLVHKCLKKLWNKLILLMKFTKKLFSKLMKEKKNKNKKKHCRKKQNKLFNLLRKDLSKSKVSAINTTKAWWTFQKINRIIILKKSTTPTISQDISLVILKIMSKSLR